MNGRRRLVFRRGVSFVAVTAVTIGARLASNFSNRVQNEGSLESFGLSASLLIDGRASVSNCLLPKDVVNGTKDTVLV